MTHSKPVSETTGWHPMSEAPRDGSSFMARRVPEDSERDFAGVRTWWGKTSHVPLYGWCYLIDEPEEVDLWLPDEWRYMVEELDD
jgi:hypothetical protein